MQRPEIQKFVGALRGQNARKGVFITTSKLQDYKHTSFASLVAEFFGGSALVGTENDLRNVRETGVL